jgi:hypothetical protein
MYKEGCWETASWDVYPVFHNSQLRKVSVTDEQSEVLVDLPPAVVQQ